MRNRLVLLAVVFVLSLGLTGCKFDLHEDYVSADRDTYEVFSPMIEYWVSIDGELDSESKDDYLRLLRSWEYRLVAAEHSLDEGSKDE